MDLKFAPCSFCYRKPGFFSDGLNFCWIHWNSKNIAIDIKKNIEKEKLPKLKIKNQNEKNLTINR